MTHVSMGWVRSYRTFSPLPRRFAHRNVPFPASGKGYTLCGISSFPSNPLTLGFDGSPLKGKAVSLCCTCPGVTPGGRYPLSLPCGARTFLIWVLSVPIRGCPPRSRIYCTSWGGKSQMSCKFFSERIYYIICLPVQLSITYTNWEFVEFPVIASQCAHWRGNPLVRRTTSRG